MGVLAPSASSSCSHLLLLFVIRFNPLPFFGTKFVFSREISPFLPRRLSALRSIFERWTMTINPPAARQPLWLFCFVPSAHVLTLSAAEISRMHRYTRKFEPTTTTPPKLSD
ncbi:unnamed protein product [Sphacelaria rigidula]